MEKFLKVASPLALVAGMAGFAMTGTALASGPGDYAGQAWITPPIVQNAPTASQPVWDDLGTTGTVVQAPEYEYLPPVATAPVQQSATPVQPVPLPAPKHKHAEKPVKSAKSSSCHHRAPQPCGHHAPRPHFQMPTYGAPMFAPPVYQQPAYQQPAYHHPLPVARDRIVEKKVFVDRPIERKVYVNRPIYIDRPVYVPRPVPVVKKVPVPVDRPVYVEKRVAVPVVKHVQVPVDRPVYINRPVAAHVPAPVVAPSYSTGCALPTITQPAHSNCYGHGGGHAVGGYAAPASYKAPVVSGGYEYYGNTGFGAVAGYAAEDCCAGGAYIGGGIAAAHPYGGPAKHAFRNISDHISKISARIADGENSGMITAMEAANLRKKIQSVSNNLTEARQDGRFEEREIEIVAANVRQLAEQMKVAKQNEKIVEEQQKLAEQFAKAYSSGAHGITAAHLRPQYGMAGAFLPSAQYPALQQALPYAYGGFGGMGFGGLSTY